MTRTRAFLLVIIIAMLGDLVLRGIVPSLTAGKNDFSDPFVGAWLWRHGSNPYDVALASAAGKRLTESQVLVVPIYPPTTFLLVAPITFLPWGWANFVLAVLGTLGVCLIAFCVVRLAHRRVQDDKAWIMIALVLAFAPFHTSLHVANVSVISTALCVLAVYLASCDHDLAGGFTLAVATCLKPHLGIWIFGFYLLRRRWRLLAAGALSGALLAVIALAQIPLPPHALLANYQANLQHWFQPGGQNDFSLANPLRFQLANFQVVLQPLLGSTGANAVALGVVALAVGLWIYAVSRKRACPEALALSSLLALSFLPVYHRVYDTGVLTLSLAWIFSDSGNRLDWMKRIALALLILLLLPFQSAVVRSETYLPLGTAQSWWWNLAVAPYASWILLAFSAVLLYAVLTSAGTASLASPLHDLAHEKVTVAPTSGAS